MTISPDFTRVFARVLIGKKKHRRSNFLGHPITKSASTRPFLWDSCQWPLLGASVHWDCGMPNKIEQNVGFAGRRIAIDRGDI